MLKLVLSIDEESSYKAGKGYDVIRVSRVLGQFIG